MRENNLISRYKVAAVLINLVGAFVITGKGGIVGLVAFIFLFTSATYIAWVALNNHFEKKRLAYWSTRKHHVIVKTEFPPGWVDPLDDFIAGRTDLEDDWENMDPVDTTVEARAKEIERLLIESGNPYNSEANDLEPINVYRLHFRDAGREFETVGEFHQLYIEKKKELFSSRLEYFNRDRKFFTNKILMQTAV